MVPSLLLLPPNALAFKLPQHHLCRHQAPASARQHPFFAMAADNSWPASNVTAVALMARVSGRLLHPITDEKTPEWIVSPVSDREPNPPAGYVVCFLAFLDRGFGIPASRFMRALVHYYGVELHNFNPHRVFRCGLGRLSRF